MTVSKLASYQHITKNHSGNRTSKITKITPHYMAGAMTGKQCADYFASTDRQASSNYCIGPNGDIAVSVPEEYRAWTSSSNWNDQRSITIECANNPDSSLSDATYKALVKLCADICKRYGINPHYDGTQNGSITFHAMFAATSCPGAWLKAKITSGQLEKDIKAQMGQTTTTKPATPAKPSTPKPAATTGKLESYSGYVEVTYSGKDGLAYHNKASWSDSTIAGFAKKGEVFTITGRQKVDGVYMYRLKSGMWITSSSTYVKYKKTISKATPKPAKKSISQIATEVINGAWGNGTDRKNRLTAAGYDYNAVQAEVNKRFR